MTTPQHTQHEAHDHQHHIDDPAQPNGNGGHGGHDKHAGHDPEVFRQLFWWNLVLAVPVLVFSKQIQDWFDYSIDGAWAAWIAPVVGTVIFLWGGKPFLAGGVAEVRNRQPGMMLLISLAITVAYGSSLASSFGWGDLDFWWELAALIVVMLLGHWQEMKAIGQAQGALAALAELLPDTAERVSGNSVQEVAIADLAVDDVVLVRPGGRVPADGVIVDGRAALDESMITGESRPVTRSDGDRVVAGTVSTDSSVRVRIDAVGDDTALAGIHRLVADAQSSQSRVQALADRAAAALFYLATTAAIITFVACLDPSAASRCPDPLLPLSGDRPSDPVQSGAPGSDDDGATPNLSRRVFVKSTRARSNTTADVWREADVAPTLNTFDRGHSRSTVIVVEEDLSPRTLTLVEMERLMGWPDDFTRFRDDGREQSPTARHKQIGNGVAAPVAEWVARQIMNA